MKNRSSKFNPLKKLDLKKSARSLSGGIFTLRFWKRIGLATMVVMAAIGSYVTLKSFSFTKSIVQTVEKPIVGTWKDLTGSDSGKKSNVVAKKSNSSKKYKKSSSKKQSKIAKKKTSNKSRYAKNRSTKSSKDKKKRKVIASSYKLTKRH